MGIEDEEDAQTTPVERRLVAILAADIEGYSRQMHENEEATLATLLSHRQIIEGLVATAHGRITGTAGDSVLAEFASILDAVHCGVAIQLTLADANAALLPERRMLLRIGINVGDVIVQEGDVFGEEVNIAARLEGLADPGGICVSRGVRDQVRDRVAYDFEDLGEQPVKNIARPVRVFRLHFEPDAGFGQQFSTRGSPVGSDEQVAVQAVEISFWQSVEAGGTADEYRAYLDTYPEGAFARLAQVRLAAAENDTSGSLTAFLKTAFSNT